MWGFVKGMSPDEYCIWEIIGGKIPEWSAKRIYIKGDEVSYNGTQYQATGQMFAGENPDKYNWGWKAIEGATSPGQSHE
ncbi:hypothetical protein CN553_28025, partial [Bacillus cereus]